MPSNRAGWACCFSFGSEARSSQGPTCSAHCQRRLLMLHHICKGTEQVPPNRYLQPSKDSDVTFHNGLRWKQVLQEPKCQEGREHVLSAEDKMRRNSSCRGTSEAWTESRETQSCLLVGSRRAHYLWASDLLADRVVAPEGSSSSSSSSSSSDSCSFLSSIVSEMDFWRFLSGSEESVQIEV